MGPPAARLLDRLDEFAALMPLARMALLTDLDGQALAYGAPKLMLARGLVASNGVLHPGLMSAVNWAEREARRIGGI